MRIYIEQNGLWELWTEREECANVYYYRFCGKTNVFMYIHSKINSQNNTLSVNYEIYMLESANLNKMPR